LRADLALPAAVLGPVDFCAFCLLAVAFAFEDMETSPGVWFVGGWCRPIQKLAEGNWKFWQVRTEVVDLILNFKLQIVVNRF
jgi:hypothetical protein